MWKHVALCNIHNSLTKKWIEKLKKKLMKTETCKYAQEYEINVVNPGFKIQLKLKYDRKNQKKRLI